MSSQMIFLDGSRITYSADFAKQCLLEQFLQQKLLEVKIDAKKIHGQNLILGYSPFMIFASFFKRVVLEEIQNSENLFGTMKMIIYQMY